MPSDPTIGGTATLTRVDRAALDLRIEALVQDPVAEILASLDPDDLGPLAGRNPALALRLAETQQVVETLAVDAFEVSEDDELVLALCLLDLCPPNVVRELAEKVETERQRWMLGEYLLGRFPDILTEPTRILGTRAETQHGPLLEVAGFVAQGQSRPLNLEPVAPETAPEARASAPMKLFRTVIVHGTFAKSFNWWRQHDGLRNFWAYIKEHCPALYGTGQEFSWSAENHHRDREQGAREFINWWHTVGAPTPLQVIAHSHGCNVVYLACTMEPRLRIVNMVALGGPVRIWYPPTIGRGRIERIHNIYSRFDKVQSAGSLGGRRGEGRTLSDSVSVTNIHLPWQHPSVRVETVGHGDLHAETVWRNHGLANITLL